MEKLAAEELKSKSPLNSIAPPEVEPEETREQKREKLRILFGITSFEHTFENFRPVTGTNKSFSAFKSMAEGKHKPMLLMCGGVGNGKTYLCEALSIALYRQGIRCPITLWAEFRRQLLQKMHRPRPGDDYDRFFEEFRRRQHIIIDDVGMGSKGSEWEMAELEDIINFRYRERLFTVLTTNRTLEDLPERVVSRFFDAEVSEVVINEGKRRKGL